MSAYNDVRINGPWLVGVNSGAVALNGNLTVSDWLSALVDLIGDNEETLFSLVSLRSDAFSMRDLTKYFRQVVQCVTKIDGVPVSIGHAGRMVC